MHSSRMRTVCCSGRVPGGGGGVCLPTGGGVSAQVGCLSGGVSVGGGGSQGVSARYPLCEQSHKRVKTLPCRNYVADGNNLTFTTNGHSSARFGYHHCNCLSPNQRPCYNDIPTEAMMTGSKRSRPISDADGIRDNNDWMLNICRIINPVSFCQYS